MSKGNKIRLSKTDKSNITTLTRLFNTKLTKTIKAHPEFAEYLPPRIKADDLRSIDNRKDFNNTLREYSRFLKKGAEMPVQTDLGIKTTRWEIKEVGYKVAKVNRARTIEAKKADVSTTKGTMGTIKSNNLSPKKYNVDKIKPKDWDMYKKGVEKQSKSDYLNEKMIKYKENYLKSVLFNLGKGVQAQEFYKYVEDNVSPELMYSSYYDDPLLQIQFTSDPLPVDTIIESAFERWKTLIEG